jgi:hypothetical protein
MKRAFAFTSNQRGAGRIKLTFVVIVISVLAVLAFKGLPVYITDQELQHDVKEVARTSAVRNSSEAQIRKELMKAQEGYWVTLPENTQYNVTKSAHGVQIEVNTVIPINFIVTTYEYKINVKIADSDI